jgi:Kef-type K+ transport system membrane component KefB
MTTGQQETQKISRLALAAIVAVWVLLALGFWQPWAWAGAAVLYGGGIAYFWFSGRQRQVTFISSLLAIHATLVLSRLLNRRQK